MCGRFTNKLTWAEIHALYTITSPPLNFAARYNIAPTQDVPVVRQGENGRTLSMLRWGLVPSWAKDRKIGASMINARAEGVAEKPAFRVAFRTRRCLVPASGFYEWIAEGKKKQPVYITAADGGALTFAGLWERWSGEGETVESFTIITTAPNAVCAAVHDRMPVILGRADWDAWLDPQRPKDEALTLLRACPDALLTTWKVDARVNTPRVDDPTCIAPLRATGELAL
jgi:putative SOS response-associated peptidase YedK